MAEQKIGAPAGSFRKYLGVFAVLAATGIPAVQAANPFATVATVGEDIITRYEVDQYIAIRTHNTNIPNSSEFEQQALDELIDARLIAKEARRYRVSVSRSEVDSLAGLSTPSATESAQAPCFATMPGSG